jgi:VCBS repeat-containing protein
MARGNGKGNAGIINKPVTGTDGDDILAGSAAIINGGDGDDQITGSDLIERINAGDGDDFIFAGGGDDTVYGNGGTDTLILTGSLQDAVLTAGKGNSLLLTTADGGTDTLKHIEFLQFDDFTYEVGVNNGVFSRADSAATDEDTAVTIDALANDFDFEGDSFEITAFDATSANGAAVTLVNGQFVYDGSGAAAIQALENGDSLTDTFTYTVTDAAGNVTTETVSVEVAGLSDSTVIDFDSGTNTVDYDYGYYQYGTYQEDGFTLNWWSEEYDYYYYYYGDTVPAVTDIDGDGDRELGVDGDVTSYYYYGYQYAGGTLTQDNGDSFSLIGFEMVGDDASSYYNYSYFQLYSYSNGWSDYTYAYTYDDGQEIWYVGGYNNGVWSSYQTDQATVADSVFEDVDALYFYAYTEDYYGYGSNGNGIGIAIDNLEIA